MIRTCRMCMYIYTIERYAETHDHSFVPSTHTGTATHSTLKSKEVDSSKFTSSAADTATVADDGKGAEGTECGEEKGAFELIAHLGDDDGKARDDEVPITTGTITSSGEAAVEGLDAQDSL